MAYPRDEVWDEAWDQDMPHQTDETSDLPGVDPNRYDAMPYDYLDRG